MDDLLVEWYLVDDWIAIFSLLSANEPFDQSCWTVCTLIHGWRS